MARVEISETVAHGSPLAPGAGLSAQVNYRGGTVAATVYADSTSGTVLGNPLTTSALGRIEGWLEEGSYDLVVSGTGFATYTQRVEAVSGRTLGVFNVKSYGAKGDGTTDDSAAFAAVIAAATEISGAGNGRAITDLVMKVPAGRYKINSALAPALTAFRIEGAGRDATEILLADGIYFIDAATQFQHFTIQGLQVRNGAGVLRLTNSSTNVQGQYVVEDCNFYDYTAACISHNASDMPYWRVERNLFHGANSTGTIGVALSGLTDNCVIRANAFQRNRVHVKLAQGGNNAKVVDNDFIRWDTVDTHARIDVWAVPHTSTTNAGQGLVVSGNKFGNENIVGTDERIVYADQGAGSDFGTKFPTLSADSTGYVIGHQVYGNNFSGTSSPRTAMVYSTTPYVRGCRFAPNVISGSLPTYVLEFRTVPSPEHNSTTNVLGPNQAVTQGHDDVPSTFQVSNAYGMGLAPDPTQQWEGTAGNPHALMGGSDFGSYTDLAIAGVNSFATGGGSSLSPITDRYGGGDAAEVTLPNGTGVSAEILAANIVAGKPVWVEFDLKDGAATPLTTVDLWIRQFGPTEFHERRQFDITSRWERHRIMYVPRTVNGVTQLYFNQSTGSQKQFKLGKVKVYQAREPVQVTPRPDLSETVASAATIAVKDHTRLVSVTGTTNITSVTASYPGHVVTLVFAGALTFTDGSNLKLAGDFVTTADDTITLVSDGTNWIETGRSVN